MNTVDRAAAGARQLAACLSRIDPDQMSALEDAIDAAESVFVAGAGRSLLELRCFAMRLMHLGYTAHVVGDTTTPAFRAGDLLIAGSGSGTTPGVVRIAERARRLGGTLACLTIRAESPLGGLADLIVEIPAFTDKERHEGMGKPVLPGGGAFESAILLLGDAMVVRLGERRGVPTDRAFDLHANLE